MEPSELFAAHLTSLGGSLEEALEQTGFQCLVLSSGEPHTYFADDEQAPFRPTPHFARWCPVSGPHHLLKLRPGARPRLIRHAPRDYWYEQAPLGDPFWLAGFELEEVPDVDAAWQALGPLEGGAYIGNETARAEGASLAANPAALTARLDWARSYKTDYEVLCLEEATALAARGHRAARNAFLAGASELQIHHAYVEAMGVTDAQLPYASIVALDEKGATLHYEGKRTTRGGQVLLIDAGAGCRGYASDITRTHASQTCDPGFVALLEGMQRLELELCAAVRPGLPYLELHLQAHRAIGRLLSEQGQLRVGADEAVDKGLTRPFFPHGLGHHLGIQVHDVAGKVKGPEGEPAPPPPEHLFLRNTRTIEPGQVFTIEPGLYFIPMLLLPFREGEHAGLFDWKKIDALTPLGGIRVEDNVLVTERGQRNLTREALPD